MDTIFGKKPEVSTQVTGPTQVAQPGVALPGTQQTANTDANGIVPTQSPLDQHKELWDIDPTKEKQSEPISFNVDAKKLQEAAAKTDFSKVITPEVLQAITAGGEGAAQAFVVAMNQMTQASYAQSALASTKMIEQALAKQAEQFKAELPNIIRNNSASERLRETNPALSHPAAAPIIEAVQARMAAKHPNASSAELAKMSEKYVLDFVTANSPKQETSQSTGKNASPDWTLFLSEDS